MDFQNVVYTNNTNEMISHQFFNRHGHFMSAEVRPGVPFAVSVAQLVDYAKHGWSIPAGHQCFAGFIGSQDHHHYSEWLVFPDGHIEFYSDLGDSETDLLTARLIELLRDAA